jgi:hypothetical protein
MLPLSLRRSPLLCGVQHGVQQQCPRSLLSVLLYPDTCATRCNGAGHFSKIREYCRIDDVNKEKLDDDHWTVAYNCSDTPIALLSPRCIDITADWTEAVERDISCVDWSLF